MSKDAYNKFLHNTYSGERLLKEHALTEYGVWMVEGEDPNPDLGGHHHSPKLGIFEGVLDDVVRYAVQLNGFWAWGGGGSISRYTAPKITRIDPDSVARIEDLKARRNTLRAELERINKELDD